MKIFLYVLVLCLFAAVYAIRMIHHTHMFQLNSYKSGVQVRWMLKNPKELLKTTLILPLSVALLFVSSDDRVTLALVAGSLLAALLLNIPGKAKKSLVYTKRVIRLLVTTGILLAAALLVVILVLTDVLWKGVAIFSVLTLAPLILLLCNLINQPLERAINRYYIRDAKKILRAHGRLVTIGVTGSYGKTSVKYMLGTLLEAKYNTLITPESYNTPLGITRVVRSSLRATHEVFVCEMGAKYVGDIEEICDIVHPRHGIITSIGPQHLESFKSLDNVKKTKFELADALPPEGKLFLNGEDAGIRGYAHPHPGMTYGFSPSCDYYADRLQVTSAGTTFYVNHEGASVKFDVSLIGAHNVLNLVGAIAVCCELGIELDRLPPYARKVKAVQHRLQLSKKGNVTIIDDAYNSNPSGAKAALDVLALFSDKKIIVTPGMVELGSVEYRENYTFGQNMVGVCDYVVLVGKKQTAPIYQGLVDAGYPADRIYVATDVQSGIRQAFAMWPDEPKTVLLENDLPDNY